MQDCGLILCFRFGELSLFPVMVNCLKNNPRKQTKNNPASRQKTIVPYDQKREITFHV